MISSRDNFVGQILIEENLITSMDLEAAVLAATAKDISLCEYLKNEKILSEADFWKTVSKRLGLTFLEEIKPDDVDIELIKDLPIVFAKNNRVIPLEKTANGVKVACADPFELNSLDTVQSIIGCPVEAVVSLGEVILNVINAVYERSGKDEDLEGEGAKEEEELTDLIDAEDEAPIIRWVNNLFFEAVRRRASDIHIEPLEKEVGVRYRVDGVLQNAKNVKKAFLASIISRVKILAKLNIAEKRLPQDGRISLKIAGRPIDVRVSTVPTSQGERVVMRLLDKQAVLHDVSDLGFWKDHYTLFHSLIKRPHGIILVTGPTGSGKTTTLYAGLSQINTPDRNILTVEDPVEYDIEGIGQVHVNPKIDLTFSSGLRAFLRQDPDVIMVGEIRDRETAEIAVQSSLTGHLVISTIHTNDAAGALTRLVEMDIEPFLVASSMIGIQAQRLVRVLCPHCKELFTPTREQLEELGANPDNPYAQGAVPQHHIYQNAASKLEPLKPLTEGVTSLYRAVGCDECLGLGYKGRTGLYEMLMITDEIRALVLKNADSNTIKKVALEEGMVNLREDGIRKVLSGVTSIEEVLRVTHDDMD
ncbi:MAG: type II secretion system ATPase GspE [Deltaproteobacteria bacterium]|nr:type II secretion system ATPase GspE [Deltaproteobacteria bacterium]